MSNELRLDDNMVHVEMENGKACTLLFLSSANSFESAEVIDKLVESDGDLDLRMDFDVVGIANDVIDLHRLIAYDNPVMEKQDRPMIEDLMRQLKEAFDLLSKVEFVPNLQGN